MPTELTDSPTAWFALLERAKRTGDVDLALKAQEQLRQLGVKVEFQARPLKVMAGGSTGAK